MSNQWQKSVAQMDDNDTFVESIYLREVNNSVPENLFCLKRLRYLQIENMIFINGKKSQ